MQYMYIDVKDEIFHLIKDNHCQWCIQDFLRGAIIIAYIMAPILTLTEINQACYYLLWYMLYVKAYVAENLGIGSGLPSYICDTSLW